MQMIGLRDVTCTAQDELGRVTPISFKVDELVEVPDSFATIAKSIGYAKPVDEDEDKRDAA